MDCARLFLRSYRCFRYVPMCGDTEDSFGFGRECPANSRPGLGVRIVGQRIHRISVAYEDCGHCGHEIEQELEVEKTGGLLPGLSECRDYRSPRKAGWQSAGKRIDSG